MITLDELTRGRRERTVTLGEDWQRAKGGLYVPLDALPLARKVRRYGTRPIALDLFAGCGGMSLGFKQAGFNVIAAFDLESYALVTYMANLCRYGQVQIHYATPGDRKALERSVRRLWKIDVDGAIGEADAARLIGEKVQMAGSGWIAHQPDDEPGTAHIFVGDVRKWTGPEILMILGLERGDIDVVAGGPPCQGFSVAGKRNVYDDRNSLVFEFCRLVLELQPKTFLMENVPGMASMVTKEGIPVIDAICRVIADGGFGSYEGIKKSLLATSGAGAVMQGAHEPHARKQRHPGDWGADEDLGDDEEAESADPQLAMAL